jgi:hypothetical protein
MRNFWSWRDNVPELWQAASVRRADGSLEAGAAIASWELDSNGKRY